MAIVKKSFNLVPTNKLLDSTEFCSQTISSQEHDYDDDDCDSGAGFDDFDLLELGESGEEFCQIGDQTCSIPFELYRLPGLEHILSMDVWNDVLTEHERFSLTKYLPDMDHEHFVRTMKDLFTGSNFHFGVPMEKLFDMLKGGLCDPRVSLYRQGLGFFQKHRRYHVIRKHQNTMLDNLFQIHEAWSKCRGCSIEEKLRVLNVLKSRKRLISEKIEELENESSSEESADGMWVNDHKQKWVHYPGYQSSPTLALEPINVKMKNPRGTLKVSGTKISTTKEQVKAGASSFLSKQIKDHEEQMMHDVILHRDHNLIDKIGRKVKAFRGEEALMGLSDPMKTDMHSIGRNRTVNQLSDIEVLAAIPTNSRFSYNYGKKLKQSEYNQNIDSWNPRGSKLSPMDSQQESFWHRSAGEPIDLHRTGMKKGRMASTQNGRLVMESAEGMQMLTKGEETESDSSDQFREDADDDNPLMRSKWAYTSGVKSRPTFKGPKLREGMSSRITYPGGKKRKGEFGNDYSNFSPMHINDYVTDMVDVRLLECNSGTQKRKVKDELMYMDDYDQESQGQNQLDDDVKTFGKRKWMDEMPFENMIPDTNVTDKTGEDDYKTQKRPFTLITPTVHTGFSFSVIHLLSAVRMAMVTLLPEDNVNDDVRQEVNVDQGITSCDSGVNPCVPSLTVKDIVNRVRSNPGDPCVLETQEPLQDLVRGVLKILSSKTAPLGAKGWKALVVYKKPVKSWSWVGPVSQSLSDLEIVEEVTSPESWGLPHRMLVKLVDSFANWLKSGQETLKQIGSLLAPPLTLMQVNLDEKERFRDSPAQKSLNTINPSSEEVRDYFRKEEVLRYLIPDRAFAYTAVDGKKSTVAPSRKGAGKPTSKAREHFMLKQDRPPHVTILCLVRDAAARLPGSIGTRADICTLIRDSQYIVEDISDSQVTQVVSGALDRLHYECDPCVQYDSERKLWVYLHREREEEDFEDDATSSTKRWKRQKKEPAEPGGAVTLAYHGTSEPAELDSMGIEPSDINNNTAQGFDEEVEVLNTSVC